MIGDSTNEKRDEARAEACSLSKQIDMQHSCWSASAGLHEVSHQGLADISVYQAMAFHIRGACCAEMTGWGWLLLKLA